jgi:glyoxylate utilization-related uncharacterized protein
VTGLSALVADPLAGQPLGREGFVLVEWQDPGGVTGADFPIAPLHRHLEDAEAWYVVSGRLGFRLADETVEVGPGGAVHVPPSVAHTFWNAAPGPTRYVLVMTPRIKALIDGLHALPSRDRATLEAHFAAHASELL